MKLWQLKNRKDGTVLSEPQPLPENWGPIFGLSGFADRLNDLSWLGEPYTDLGWFEVGDGPALPTPSTPAELVWDRAKRLLAESDWSMLPDVPMSSGDKAAWVEYRRVLREIRLQPSFPTDPVWPQKPE